MRKPAQHSAIAQLRARMRSCEQMPGLSVLAHGQSVLAHYRTLVRHLKISSGTPLPGWRWPSWLADYALPLLHLQAPFSRAAIYQVYHDCGKPAVRVCDDEGKRHFPGHAEASAQIFSRCFPDQLLEQALIREDMRIHTMPASEIETFLRLSEEGIPLWPTLLLTALCELHANALMFGGVDSTSFKSKSKQLDRRGRALCKQGLPFNTNTPNPTKPGVIL